MDDGTKQTTHSISSPMAWIREKKHEYERFSIVFFQNYEIHEEVVYRHGLSRCHEETAPVGKRRAARSATALDATAREAWGKTLNPPLLHRQNAFQHTVSDRATVKASSLRNQWRSEIAHGAPLLPLETQR
jgi:hypothetical protein